MNYHPILFLGFLVLVACAFLVFPFVLIRRLPLLSWQKVLLGFNYYLLLSILCMNVNLLGHLLTANRVAQSNLTTLVRILQEEPREAVTAALEEHLARDENTYYLLLEKFPEKQEEAEDSEAAEAQ